MRVGLGEVIDAPKAIIAAIVVQAEGLLVASARVDAQAPVLVEVRGLEKSFRIPEYRVDTLKERVTKPFSRPSYRLLRALVGVSFDVRRGEFFGVVGRNGSGKSTLLKILSSIYRADAGTIRMGGRLAPFISSASVSTPS